MRHTFRAMGTEVTIVGPDDATHRAFGDAAARVEAIFEREEQRFSRFRHDSELSQLNARGGGQVSASFAEVTHLALAAARETNGLFDPTILPELVAAGYDRDFGELRATPMDAPQGARLTKDVRPNWTAVELDGDELRLPGDIQLDFGGLAKGWAVDLAATDATASLSWVVVDAGGDARIAGDAPDDLEIAIEDPFDTDEEVARLRLHSGAVATSSTVRRSWGPGRHHLIDPKTGRPSMSGVAQVTVWAANCARAEILAKWALLTGPGTLAGIAMVQILDSGEIVSNLIEPGRRSA